MPYFYLGCLLGATQTSDEIDIQQILMIRRSGFDRSAIILGRDLTELGER
jgi:hypothetical protein